MAGSFDFLKPKDIPPRRSKNGKRGSDNDDVLTRLLFSSYDHVPEDSDPKDRLSEELFSNAESEITLASVGYIEREVPKVSVSKASLKKAFEDLGYNVELLNVPLPLSPRPPNVPKAKPQKKPEIQLAKSATVTQENIARANENWFDSHPESIKKTTSPPSVKSFKKPKKKRSSQKTILTSFLVVGFLAVALAATQTNFFSGGKNLLSTSSFTLVNAEQETTFPLLFLFHKNVSELSENLFLKLSSEEQKKSELASQIKELDSIVEGLENFFSQNKKFSWTNMFSSGGGVLSKNSPSWPMATELIEKAIMQKKSFETLYGREVAPSNENLKQYLGWLLFWQGLLSSDGKYLVVSTHPTHMSPVMGEPYNYTVVDVTQGRLVVGRSDKVETLNAAINTKIIPPSPVQFYKTSFDFFETGWFLDFKVFSKTFLDLYEKTTDQKVKGLVLVSNGFLQELTKKQVFSFGPQNVNWLSNVFSALERRSSVNSSTLERTLGGGIADHRLELFFKDETLEGFVEENNLSLSPLLSSTEDSIAFGFRQWEGGELEIELVEYKPKFSDKGEILSSLNFFLRNNTKEEITTYAKVYLPAQSELLRQEGFKSKQIPSFDYQANGFLPLGALRVLEEKAPDNIDLFLEGNFLVVGGWLVLPPQKRKTLTIDYQLPERLGLGSDGEYRLRVFKSGIANPPSFRFQASYGDDTTFKWIQPAGFSRDDKAEYQTTLWRDTVIKATIKNKES